MTRWDLKMKLKTLNFKQWFTITPSKRIWFSFGIGWIFAVLVDVGVESSQIDNEYTYIVWLAAALMSSFINNYNIAKFKKETTWMTLTNHNSENWRKQ